MYLATGGLYIPDKPSARELDYLRKLWEKASKEVNILKALLFPAASEGLALKLIFNNATQQNQTLKLYKNNITPASTDTAATYTEATFTGYAALNLTGSTWTTNTASSPAVNTYTAQTFTSTAGSQNESEYGYFVIQQGSGLLLYAERFSNGPYVIQNNGDSITITPTVSAS